jgi:hypothetical protein
MAFSFITRERARWGVTATVDIVEMEIGLEEIKRSKGGRLV